MLEMLGRGGNPSSHFVCERILSDTQNTNLGGPPLFFGGGDPDSVRSFKSRGNQKFFRGTGLP